jgi:putative tricarboxylic transport membrane protein
VIAPETANNACIGGANIPMLTLGIPGDAGTAVMIAALLVHGLKPGPMLMVDTPHLFWFWVGALTLGNFFMLILGMTGIKLFAKLVEIKKGLLLPMIIIISVVGTYAINNSLTDVYWMLGFGIYGYVLKMYGFQVGPVILGIILGPLMEEGFRRAMIDQHDSLFGFLIQLVANPLTLVLTLAIIFSMVSQTQLWGKMKRTILKRS